MEELARLAKLLAKETTKADETRAKLYAGIRQAIANGERQVDIVKATGYTREMIRRITSKD